MVQLLSAFYLNLRHGADTAGQRGGVRERASFLAVNGQIFV